MERSCRRDGVDRRRVDVAPGQGILDVERSVVIGHAMQFGTRRRRFGEVSYVCAAACSESAIASSEALCVQIYTIRLR